MSTHQWPVHFLMKIFHNKSASKLFAKYRRLISSIRIYNRIIIDFFSIHVPFH